MIDPEQVVKLKRYFETLGPPVVPVLSHRFPVVQWVTPELSSLAEVIRWHSSDHAWVASWLQVKLILVGPNVGTAVGNEDRHIAKKLDTFIRGVTF